MDYNEYRPHESLGDVPPAVFLSRVFERNVFGFKLPTCQGSLRPQKQVERRALLSSRRWIGDNRRMAGRALSAIEKVYEHC